ncbi:hypothetical protein FOZ63_001486 [Perkinsus olseni]|uniref:Secreted protein n=1 Tax=Perkinsus olseni TaxID=32597 RepID=A0A7J6R3X1_PEROL|nr:hypothetical protein FOZ60_012220 [Perkinsus olseni]KAF4715308.1 hypothetical protein FOZ63_001486 [Perkinsus olseni]
MHALLASIALYSTLATLGSALDSARLPSRRTPAATTTTDRIRTRRLVYAPAGRMGRSRWYRSRRLVLTTS